jgi:putative transposase
MQNKFNNKYRIPSTRLQFWDYSNDGAYFITICTKNREHFFGIVENSKMQLSEIGKFVEQYWIEIPNHFPFIELGNFVVMPNHVHGILIINNNVIPVNASKNDCVNNQTLLIASLQREIGGFSGNKNPMLNDNILKIIRWYKGRCSFECRKIHADFAWQSRFHDHIIRNSKSFEIIQNYIFENPLKWKIDKFYKK